MGHPIEPDLNCPDCCETMDSTVMVVGFYHLYQETYTGYLTKTEKDKCRFEGVIVGEYGGIIACIVRFCNAGTSEAIMDGDENFYEVWGDVRVNNVNCMGFFYESTENYGCWVSVIV